MSIRIEKVNQLLKREIAKILEEDIEDKGIGFVSITHVFTSPDLRHAKVYYSILGDEIQKKKTGKVLNQAKGYIKRLISQRVRLRYLPDIEFLYDESIEYSLCIENLFKKIQDGEKDKRNNK